MLAQCVVPAMSIHDWDDQQRHPALGGPEELVFGCMLQLVSVVLSMSPPTPGHRK